MISKFGTRLGCVKLTICEFDGPRVRPKTTSATGRGQNCRRIVQETANMGEGGVKNTEKLPTKFMDGPSLLPNMSYIKITKLMPI